jgi:AbrB family looped-hinge helix DNA binding protein
MTMPTTKVTRNFQVTIPAEVRKALSIKIGALVDFVVEKGMVIMRPKKLVDEDQAWFWSKEWQAHEKEAESSLKKGQGISFANVHEMKKHFEK